MSTPIIIKIKDYCNIVQRKYCVIPGGQHRGLLNLATMLAARPQQTSAWINCETLSKVTPLKDKRGKFSLQVIITSTNARGIHIVNVIICTTWKLALTLTMDREWHVTSCNLGVIRPVQQRGVQMNGWRDQGQITDWLLKISDKIQFKLSQTFTQCVEVNRSTGETRSKCLSGSMLTLAAMLAVLLTVKYLLKVQPSGL